MLRPRHYDYLEAIQEAVEYPLPEPEKEREQQPTGFCTECSCYTHECPRRCPNCKKETEALL